MELCKKYFYFLCAVCAFFMATKGASAMQLPIYPMEEFSGLSRDQILEKRVAAVKKSIFSADDYSPNASVFLIESGLPWISAHEVTCYGQGTKGPSRESFAILNPPVLYYPLMAAYNFSKTTGCSAVDYLLVNRLTYDEKSNLITAHINYTAFYRKNRVFYRIHLSDTNARDLGYNYVFAKSVRNIRFAENNNISTKITPTRGFYHRGGSCGVAGGCNNYSPRQAELEFYIEKLPAEIYFKLWKFSPINTDDEADINYRLIFD